MGAVLAILVTELVETAVEAGVDAAVVEMGTIASDMVEEVTSDVFSSLSTLTESSLTSVEAYATGSMSSVLQSSVEGLFGVVEEATMTLEETEDLVNEALDEFMDGSLEDEDVLEDLDVNIPNGNTVRDVFNDVFITIQQACGLVNKGVDVVSKVEGAAQEFTSGINVFHKFVTQAHNCDTTTEEQKSMKTKWGNLKGAMQAHAVKLLDVQTAEDAMKSQIKLVAHAQAKRAVTKMLSSLNENLPGAVGQCIDAVQNTLSFTPAAANTFTVFMTLSKHTGTYMASKAQNAVCTMSAGTGTPHNKCKQNLVGGANMLLHGIEGACGIAPKGVPGHVNNTASKRTTVVGTYVYRATVGTSSGANVVFQPIDTEKQFPFYVEMTTQYLAPDRFDILRSRVGDCNIIIAAASTASGDEYCVHNQGDILPNCTSYTQYIHTLYAATATNDSRFIRYYHGEGCSGPTSVLRIGERTYFIPKRDLSGSMQLTTRTTNHIHHMYTPDDILHFYNKVVPANEECEKKDEGMYYWLIPLLLACAVVVSAIMFYISNRSRRPPLKYVKVVHGASGGLPSFVPV